jgi:transcriptional regulator with XRE-family HTH domain
MELGKRIRSIRVNKGFSQESLAEKLGISQAAYSKMEKRAGNCSFYTLQKIAVALQVSVTYLVDIDETLPNDKEQN